MHFVPSVPRTRMPAPSRSVRSTVAVVAAGLLLLPAATTADAAPARSSSVKGGSTTISLHGTNAKRLKHAGVRLSAIGGAKSSRKGVRISIASGSVGQAGRATVLRHQRRAGLRLRNAAGRVQLTDLQLKLGKHSKLTGRINGSKRRTLFTLKVSQLRTKGQTASRSSVGLRLTTATARNLSRRLDVSRLRAGNVARASIAVQLTKSSTSPSPTPPPGPPPVGTPAAPGAAAIVAGTADWGVKTSFRNYILGFAHGKIALADGATQNPDGSFRFVSGSGSIDPASGATTARFRGTVAFEGHGSGEAAGLRLWVRNPTVVITAGTGTLYADVTSKSLSSGSLKEYPAVALGALNVAGGTKATAGTAVSWTSIPAVLTEAGVPAFADFYNPGEVLDPVSLSVSTG